MFFVRPLNLPRNGIDPFHETTLSRFHRTLILVKKAKIRDKCIEIKVRAQFPFKHMDYDRLLQVVIHSNRDLLNFAAIATFFVKIVIREFTILTESVVETCLPTPPISRWIDEPLLVSCNVDSSNSGMAIIFPWQSYGKLIKLRPQWGYETSEQRMRPKLSNVDLIVHENALI